MTHARNGFGAKLMAVLSLVAGYLVLTHVPELEKVGATILTGQPAWLLVALVLQLAYYTAFTGMYDAAFAAVGIRLGIRDLFPVVFASVFANFAAPHSGTAVFVEHATRRGSPAGRAAAAVVLAGAADFGTFALLLAVGLVHLFRVHALAPYEVIGAVLMGFTVLGWAGALVGGVAWPGALRRLLGAVERWAGAVARRLRLRSSPPVGWSERAAADFSSSASVLAGHGRGVLRTATVATVAHIADLVSLWAVARAFGVELTVGGAVATFAVGVLFWIVAITPQGVGAVEGAMSLVMVSLGVEAQSAVAVAIAFRGLTFWLPLVFGYVAARGMPWARRSGDAAPPGLRAVSTLAALTGVVNVVSAATPSLRGRMHMLAEVLPLQEAHVSRMAAVLAGFALLAVSGGLRRRKRAAWVLALCALTASVVGHLLKGLDYEEATLSLCLVVWLMVTRNSFHARSDPATVRRGLGILVGAAIFTLFYGATGFYLLDRHYAVHYGFWDAIRQTAAMFASFHDPGLQPLTGFGRYFADSIYTVAAATIGYALLSLLRPVVLRAPASDGERARAQAIVEAHGRSSLARFTLLPDKSHHFSPGGSVTAYVVRGRVALALGDPIGPPEDARDAIRDFVAHCAARDWSPAWYEVGEDLLAAYRDAGMSTLCIGHEASVRVADFALEGKAGRSLRTPLNTLARKGYTVQVHPAPLSDDLIARLEEVSDDWLTLKGGSEKRFSLGWFDTEYIGSCPVMTVADASGRVCAFANIVTEYQADEVTIDLMRHSGAAENGVMDLLFVRLIEWAREQGLAGFSLGLAPLAGVGTETGDPPLERVLHLAYQHLNRFYNFLGLHNYKEKFRPEWSPRYLVHPGTASLGAVWTAIQRADSGDSFPWSYFGR